MAPQTATEARKEYERAKEAFDAATAKLDKIERRGIEAYAGAPSGIAQSLYEIDRKAAQKKRRAAAEDLERATFALRAAVATAQAEAKAKAARSAAAEAVEAAQEAASGEAEAEARAAEAEARAAEAEAEAERAAAEAAAAISEAKKAKESTTMTDEALEAKAAAPPPGIAAPPPKRKMPEWGPAKEFAVTMHRTAMMQGWPVEIEEAYHTALVEVDNHAELIEVAEAFVVPEPAPAKNTKKLLLLAQQMQGAETRKQDGTNKGEDSFYILGSDVLTPEGRWELAAKVGVGVATVVGGRFAIKKLFGV